MLDAGAVLSRAKASRIVVSMNCNCQREESSVLQGGKPRIRYSVLRGRCSRFRFCESIRCQPSQCRMQNGKWVLAPDLYSNGSEAIANQRNRLIVRATKTQNLKAKHWKANLFGFHVRGKYAFQCCDGLLKLGDPNTEIVPLLNSLSQLRLGSSQPLPLRILVNDHDVIIIIPSVTSYVQALFHNHFLLERL